jgi:hypothetical protein
MNNQQLITSDITKKQKAVIAQRKYRERLKAGGEGKEGTETTYDTYKKSNADYMRKYRAEKKVATIEAYAKENPAESKSTTEKKIQNVEKKVSITEQRRSGRESKQVDLSIKTVQPILKPEIKKQVVPKWKNTLPPNPTEADKVIARGYPTNARDTMIKKINTVMTKVLLLTPSKDILRVIRSILTGYDVQGDLKYIRKEMPFLNDSNLIAFVNKVQNYYPKATSFNTMIIPFVNILARLESHNKEYQQLTVIAKGAAKEYSDERDENAVNEEDAGKIFSFEPEDVKYHIDNFLTNDRDKALAAVYALQPPRRLDFQYLRITEDDPSVLTDKNYNYLVVSGGEPTKFVYNNYKTYKTYKQQVFDVDADIIPYLKNHIKSAKLLPIIGQGKYLFGSNNDTQQNSNFGNKLKDVFYTMYGEEITSRWIRASAATWINGGSGKNKKSLEVRKKFAEKMAHSRELSEQYEKIIIGDADDGVKTRRSVNTAGVRDKKK